MRRSQKPVIRAPWEPPPVRSCPAPLYDTAGGQPRSMRKLRVLCPRRDS